MNKRYEHYMVILGSTSESSEDTQELTRGRNEVGDIGETTDSTSRVTTAVAEAELRELRNRIVTLEHELKVRTYIHELEFRKPLI
jgi:hypothetical protein